jgi:hypothetical protein
VRENTPTLHHVFTGLKAPQRTTSRLLRLSKRAEPGETGAAPASRRRVFCCTSITPSLAPPSSCPRINSAHGSSRRARTRLRALKPSLHSHCRRPLPLAASFWWLSSWKLAEQAGARRGPGRAHGFASTSDPNSAEKVRPGVAMAFSSLFQSLLSHTAVFFPTSLRSPPRKLTNDRTDGLRNAQARFPAHRQPPCFSRRAVLLISIF